MQIPKLAASPITDKITQKDLVRFRLADWVVALAGILLFAWRVKGKRREG
jgi:hypothetical protein